MSYYTGGILTEAAGNAARYIQAGADAKAEATKVWGETGGKAAHAARTAVLSGMGAGDTSDMSLAQYLGSDKATAADLQQAKDAGVDVSNYKEGRVPKHTIQAEIQARLAQATATTAISTAVAQKKNLEQAMLVQSYMGDIPIESVSGLRLKVSPKNKDAWRSAFGSSSGSSLQMDMSAQVKRAGAPFDGTRTNVASGPGAMTEGVGYVMSEDLSQSAFYTPNSSSTDGSQVIQNTGSSFVVPTL